MLFTQQVFHLEQSATDLGGVRKGRTPPPLNFEEQNFVAISIKR